MTFGRRIVAAVFPSRVQWRAERGVFLLCAFSGLFGGIIFRQNWMGIFAWVALVPYLVALGRFRSAKSIVWGTYIFGFIWYYLSLWWLHTLTVFSLLIPAAVPALAVIQATYFLAFAFPANFAMRRLPPWLVPWALALMWPGMEYLRTWTDLAFPWNYLGHSQVPWNGAIAQCSDGAGVYGVSLVLVLISALLATQPFSRRGDSGEVHIRLLSNVIITCIVACVIEILCAASAKGIVFKTESTGNEINASAQHIKLAVVQPGIPQTKKWDAIMGVPGDDDKAQQQRFSATEQEMRDATLGLVQQASGKSPQLYVLPETAFLSPYFVYETDLHRDLQRTAVALNADFFFGADNRVTLTDYLRPAGMDSLSTPSLPQMPTRVDDRGVTVPDWEKEPQMANFNSAWLLTPKDGLRAVAYNKIQLVPFGEMVPIIGHFEWFQRLAIAGSFYPGADAPIFESHGVKFGSVICFESAFPSLSSALARKGAQMLVVLTNDAWYDPKYLMEKGGFWGTLFKTPFLRGLAAAGPDQHFAHSIFRAIETRLPVVRAANSGISAVILPTGEVQQRLDYSTAGQFVATVAVPNHAPTFYARYGDWFAWLCLVVLVGMLGWMVTDLRLKTKGDARE